VRGHAPGIADADAAAGGRIARARRRRRHRRPVSQCRPRFGLRPAPAHPSAVGEIAARLPVSQPAVSPHLKVLKARGLVSEEAHGTRHIFRLNPAGVSALRDQLDTFWNRALASFEAAIDDTVEDQS
jgi:DNA-binding transcriptional ArsR family regulator